MNKIIIVLVTLLVNITIAYSATITGKVLNSSTQTPVEFVNVALFKQGVKAPIAGTSTNKAGIFKFTSIAEGNYSLRVSFIGFKTMTKEIKVAASDLQLANLLLVEDNTTLGTVEVVGQGSQVKFDVDKKIYSVDKNITAAGGSASDVLKNIPAVKVDNEGNVSLRKDGNVEVWINGKPSGLTADNRAQILQQMPAESIEAIEVMTNPSAKFSPEGSAGIINIVLKKNRKAGYFGSLSSGLFYPDGGKVTPTLGASINYSSSKLDAYANVGYRAMNFKGGNINNRYTLNETNRNDTLSLLQQTGVMRNAFSGIFFRAGLDFHIDSLNTISLSGFGMAGKGNSSNVIDYNFFNFENSALNNSFNRSTSGIGARPSYNVNLDYKRDLDKRGSNLMASVSYSSSVRGTKNTIIQSNAAQDVVSDIYQDVEGASKDIIAKADYTKKFTEKSKLEAGWQSSFSDRISTANAHDNINLTNPMDSYNYAFNYNEQNHAGYLTYGNVLNKFTYQAGMRAEYLMRQWLFKPASEMPVSRKYEPNLQLFPSLYLAYSLPKNNEVQLNYTRRVNRPRGRQLSPFRDMSDSTNISYGNPDLSPEYASVLEFNYLKTWDNHSISASAYYKFTDNVIQEVHFLNNKTMESTYMNIAKIKNSGVEVVAKNRLFTILNLTSTFNLYHSAMNAATYTNPYNNAITTTIPAQSTLTWSANMMANFMFSKTFSGQITGEYSAPTLVAQGYESPEYSIDLGLRKTFLDRKLSLSIIAADIFNFNRERTTTWGTGFYQKNQNFFHRRMLGLTVTYNFGNVKPKPSDMKKKESGGDMMDMGD